MAFLWRRKNKANTATSNQPALIFDFDGTIANTLPIVIDLFHESGVVDIKLDDALIEELRGMSAQQVLKTVGIPIRKLPSLITKGRKELLLRLSDAKPFDDIVDVIKELSKDYDLYVMSSNSEENIRHFFEDAGLSKYFKSIHGNVSIFGKTKIMRKIIVEEKLDKEKTWYVGDETRDVEAANKIKLKIISVTWGYNNKKILSKYKPTQLADTPKDLLKILKRS